MGGSSGQVIGYRYYANFLLFIGNPIEKLLSINFDKRGWLTKNSFSTDFTLNIDQPYLYGENEGGVFGDIDIYTGTSDQQPNTVYKDYMESIGLKASGFPYQSYLVFRGSPSTAESAPAYNQPFYLGNSNYPKEMLLWPKRTRIRNDGRRQWYEVRGDGAVVCEIEARSATSPTDAYAEFTATWKVDKSDNFYPPSSVINSKTLVDSNSPGEQIYLSPLSKTTAEQYAASPGTNYKINNYGSGTFSRVDYTINANEGSAFLIFDCECDVTGQYFEAKIVSGKAKVFSFSPIEVIDEEYNRVKYRLYIVIEIKKGEMFSFYIASHGYVSRTAGSAAYNNQVGIDLRVMRTNSYDSSEIVGVDINPIHKIREILTDDTAMNKPETSVNDDNFIKAADRIWDEGLGISWSITEKSCLDAINELCYHIEAGIRVNRQTGLYEIVLFRDDWFEESEIHTIAESKIKSMQYEITNADEVINQVNVNYYDRANIKNSSFSISESGLIQTLGRVNAETVDFPYFMNMRNAEIVANWKLKILSTGAIKGTFTTGWRDARKWNRYDLIQLPWSKRWTGTILVRIVSINLGGPTNNEVSVEWVEVVPSTGMMNTTIVADDPMDKPLQPQACQYEPFELPYYLVVMALGQRKADEELAYESNFGLVGTVAEKPQENSLYAVMMTNNGDEWVRSGSIQYSVTADLDQIISKVSSSFTVKNWKKISNISAGTLIKCGRDWLGTPGEWMVFQGVDPYTGIVSVKRGALDTPPQTWGIDTKLYFCGNDIPYDPTEYIAGDEVFVSALTTTPSGVLENLGAIPIEMKARAIRPYLLANVKINGAYWPETHIVTNNIVLTWSHRNRAQQTGGEILGWYEGDVTVENGVTYAYELISENVVLDSQSNIAANNATILASVLKPNKPHTLKLWSVRDDYESYQKFEHSFFVEAASLILTATATKSQVSGNTVPAANITVNVDESLTANMKFDGSSISGKAQAGATITIQIEE